MYLDLAKRQELINRAPPVIVAVVLCILNPLLAIATERGLFGNDVFWFGNTRLVGLYRQSVVHAGALGILLGEAFFVVVIAGFAHARWLHSYLVGLGFAMLFWATYAVGLNWDKYHIERLAPVTACLIPAFLLAGACPLYLVRQVVGWRVDCATGEAVRMPLRIKEWLLVIALVPAVVVFLGVPRLAWRVDDELYWQNIAITLAVIGVSSFIRPNGSVGGIEGIK